MLKIFANGFSFKGIFSIKNNSRWSFLFYFLFLVLLLSFPLNIQIIRTGGWDLYNFTSGIQQEYPTWLPSGLPEDIEISKSGMYYENAVVSTFETTNVAGDTLYLVFAPVAEYIITDRSLVFEENRIVYYESTGNELFYVSYENINQVVRFSDLRLMPQGQAVDIFTTMIDEAFSSYAIFRSVGIYTMITFALNLLLVGVVGLIFIFVRIRFQKVTNFEENIKIIIASMTIPSLISFIIGIVGIIEINAFTSVIFQLLTPIVALFSIYKGANLKELDNSKV